MKLTVHHRCPETVDERGRQHTSRWSGHRVKKRGRQKGGFGDGHTRGRGIANQLDMVDRAVADPMGIVLSVNLPRKADHYILRGRRETNLTGFELL